MHPGARSDARGLEGSFFKAINQADAGKRWQREALAAALMRAPPTSF